MLPFEHNLRYSDFVLLVWISYMYPRGFTLAQSVALCWDEKQNNLQYWPVPVAVVLGHSLVKRVWKEWTEFASTKFPSLRLSSRRMLYRCFKSRSGDSRRNRFHLRRRLQFTCKSHCKVRRGCNAKGLQYVCSSGWRLVCSKFYCATDVWQIWKIYRL